ARREPGEAGRPRPHRRGGRRRRRDSLPRGAAAMDLEEQAPLSKNTALGTGGPTRWLGAPEGVDALVELLGWARAENLPVAAVGLGSELLPPPHGGRGPRPLAS